MAHIGRSESRQPAGPRRTDIPCRRHCVYAFGLRAPDLVAAFTGAVDAPVNVTGRPGMPDAAKFERMDVARITIASAPTLVAIGVIRKLAAYSRSPGDFGPLSIPFRHPDEQKLFQMKG